MDYMVVYTSKTGNTEKVAAEIFGVLPGGSKDIQRVEEVRGEADTYFVGFWNDKGTCSSNIMDFLSTLHGKKVALFGTCGFGGSEEYLKEVSRRVEALIPDDTKFLGSFLCGGKMPRQVLDHYKMMLEKKDTPQIRRMIQEYMQGMLHPDAQDLKNARSFAADVLEKTAALKERLHEKQCQ